LLGGTSIASGACTNGPKTTGYIHHTFRGNVVH
jgi:hypothetical protein